MEKVKKPRSLKQIENTKKLVERNRLKSIEIKKQKENGTYVKPERKKKVKKELDIIKVSELTDEDKVPELTNEEEKEEEKEQEQDEELLDYEDTIPGYEHLFKKN